MGIGACGPTFKAVEAAGEAGQRIASHTSAFDAASQICLEAAALTRQAANDACAMPSRNADRFKRLTAAVVAYATKLATLAKAKDVAVTDELNSALAAASKAEWSGLTEDANGAVASFANAVVVLLSAEYRTGVLEKTIRDVDPHLQSVLKALDGAILLQLEQIDDVKKGVDALTATMRSFPPPKRPSAQSLASASPAPGAVMPALRKPADTEQSRFNEKVQAFIDAEIARNKKHDGQDRDQAALDVDLIEASAAALVVMKHDLDEKRTAYGELRASLEAFGKAHATLAEHVGDLAAEDLLGRVTAVVKGAYASYHALSSPKPAASPGDGG